MTAGKILGYDPTGILHGVAQAKPYHPEPEERDVVAAVEEKFRNAKQDREPTEWQWEFNALYERGDQLLVRRERSDEVLRISLAHESRKLISIENILNPASRALVGKLTRVIPTFGVLPATDDEDDLRGAQVLDSFLEYFARKERMAIKWLQGQRTLTAYGNYFYELVWDPLAGQDKAKCTSCSYHGPEAEIGKPCPLCAMQNEQDAFDANQAMLQSYDQMSMEVQAAGEVPPPPDDPLPAAEAPKLVKANNGDMVVVKHETRDCYPEPGVLEPGKWRWFITAKATPVSEIRRNFPEKGLFVGQERGIYTDRSLSNFGTLGSNKLQTTYLDDHAWLKCYQEVPSAEYPEGRICYIANGILLHDGPHPLYKHIKRLPFFQGGFQRRDGQQWAESYIDNAWAIQKERNQLLTQMRAHRVLTNRPWLLKPQKSKINIDEVDDMPGRILEFNQMFGQPKFLEIPQMPEYNQQELVRMAQAIYTQATVTEQEMGLAPSDQSGRHAAIVESQSSESVRPLTLENIDELKQLYIAAVLIAFAKYESDRAWSIYGKGRIVSNTWGKANVKPGWDLYLFEQDSLSTNKALRLEQTMGLQERLQFYSDPQTGMLDRRHFSRAAGLTDTSVGPTAEAAEHVYFAELPERIKRGEPHTVKPWDDARVAVEELAIWLRGEGRRAPPELEQMIGQIFLAYSAMMPMVDPAVAPNAAPMPGQAPGGQGNPSGPQTGMGAGDTAGPPVPGQQGQSSAQILQQADKTGEKAAQTQAKREG